MVNEKDQRRFLYESRQEKVLARGEKRLNTQIWQGHLTRFLHYCMTS